MGHVSLCADDDNLLYKTVYHREEHRWCIVLYYDSWHKSKDREDEVYVEGCCFLECVHA